MANREPMRIYTIRSKPGSTWAPNSARVIPEGGRATNEGNHYWLSFGINQIEYYYKNAAGLWEGPEWLTFRLAPEGDERYGTLTGLPNHTGRWYIRLSSPLQDQLNTLQENQVFEFYVNPERIEIKEEKAKSRSRTRRGYEFQHWGNQPMVITLAGKTGGLGKELGGGVGAGSHKSYPTATSYGSRKTPSKAVPERETTAYKRLKELQNLYRIDQQTRRDGQSPEFLLGLSYRGDVYVGHFDNFTFTEAAETPFIFDLSFTFTVEFMTSSIGDAMSRLTRRILTDTETLRKLREVRQQ